MSNSATTRPPADAGRGGPLAATVPPPAASSQLAPAGAGSPHARTLLDIFNATAVRCGGATAIEAPDRTLTYRDLAQEASALGRRLAALGIGPGDRVGVCIPSGTAELYVAILGALWSGAAYVPIDADEPPARVAELLGSSGSCAVLREGLRIEELAPPAGAGREPTVDDDAWVIFTSGSTGRPKGVAVTHRSAAAFVDAEAELWSVEIEDRVLAGLSVAFDASCEEIWLAWRHGAALIPAPRALVRAGADLGPWLAERGVTVLSTVPTLAAMWDESDLSAVRLLVLGGEVCPEALAWRLAAGGREVWNTYGPTEATVVSTATQLHPGEPVTIGWPLRGWETAIVDTAGEPVAIGEAGELVISGAGLGRYLDPALDAQRFAPLDSLAWERAYRTGDIVRETIDGLQFVGRRDDQVKIGGRRIELGEVDGQLALAPGVKAALTALKRSSAGNGVLVGYVVGDVDAGSVREWVAERLPDGVVPVIAVLAELPRGRSGKVDRKALPWPLPDGAVLPAEGTPGMRGGEQRALGPAEAWLAERWVDQLGPLPLTPESDFFAMGGSSLAAARLVSVLRQRYPAVAVADIYKYRSLGDMAARLGELHVGASAAYAPRATRSRRFAAAHLLGVLSLMALAAPAWIVGALAIDRIFPGGIGPQVAWPWLIAGWLVFGSRPGRAALVAVARRVLLRDLAPGRYSRHSSLAWRVWFMERLADASHVEGLAGTPWAARYARFIGHRVGDGAFLGTIPSPTSLVTIGAGATLEDDVDARGWWMEGGELVVGEVTIGAGARLGTRTLLMPGASVGDGAEVEPGSVVDGTVPAGQRWAGSPAVAVGRAGEGWPEAPPSPRRGGAWKAMFAAGLLFSDILPLMAALPGIALLLVLAPAEPTAGRVVVVALMMAPVITVSFVVSYALVVALLFRAVSRLVKAGTHPAEGRIGWALWFSESLMAGARGVLFPLYSSLYTRHWLRLAGIRTGRRTEISTVVGLSRLSAFGATSFAADDVVLAGTRARAGWVHVAPIEVGDGTFLGNGAILGAGTRIGDRSLVGVLTTAPQRPPHETSWFGSPALELPRVPDRADPARTTDPPPRVIAARGTMDLIRVILPGALSTVLGALAFWGLDALGKHVGLWSMLLAAPLILLASGLAAGLLTVALKWLIIGRYRAGEHPLWSLFVWRDEIMNSCQEQLAGTWLLDSALGTPLMSLYLRLMGAKVGRDVWCETLTITEFELATLGDGCAVNRHSVVETHLFHDRLMRIGPATLGAGATLGPSAAMLPDTKVGDGCSVGGRSVVMRGEELPARSRWHGAPVTAR
ncbi:MAG: amino acid adenylation domain-containing protein [Acidobacteriota bacterium]|nr:amino acid adenylation domain-containing protein [Acidobacteriota bacterium]